MTEQKQMTFKDLVRDYEKYVTKTVIFQPGIEKTEMDMEKFQKAALGNYIMEEHGGIPYVKVYFWFQPFMEYNRPLMVPSYYNAAGDPCLTSEQAGMLSKNGFEYYLFELDDEVDTYFKFAWV